MPNLWKERNSIGNYLVKKQKPTNRNSPILQPATLLFPRALILRGSIAVYLDILCFNKASPLLKKENVYLLQIRHKMRLER